MIAKKLTIFVPGRLCLFGEHSDWAGLHRVINANIVPGTAIVTGIEQGICAVVERADRFIMHNEAVELQDTWVDFDSFMQARALREVAASGSYFSYVSGVASYIKEHYNVGGMKIAIKSMTLPMKSGLSSSAAICVLVARAFNLLYELNLSTMGEMSIAFKGEQRTPSRCGRLDQACAFGIQPVCMCFNGEDVTTKRLLVKNPLYWVFANLNAEKDTIKILVDLNKCYPFAQNSKEQQVQEALGIKNQEIISRAITYMKNGDADLLGQLMTEAQQIFDTMVAPASLEQLCAPKLHRFLEDKTIQELSYGGKGVGSQGDGSIQFLAKNATSQSQIAAYLQDQGLTPYTLTIKPTHSIRKAIIPIAGFGTRLYPATRMMRKEMLPFFDSDGLLKPAILILLEQLQEAGIEEICLIIGSREEEEMYLRYFQRPLPEPYREKLSSAMRNYEKKIIEIGNKLTYRIQNERHGFGHAVYQGRDFSENEAILLLLGDTLYSSGYKNCSLQLMEIFEKIEQPVIGIQQIPLDLVSHYGVVSGTWEDEEHRLMRVTKFVEKPSGIYAEQELAMPDRGKALAYYSVFGQYILTPDVFDVLEQNIENEASESGEIGMTEALAQFIGKGLVAFVINGKMHDIGNIEAYRETMTYFGNN
jgi:UTP-glucose-1-phosphate uridylyltransferase/galactokinase